MAIDRREADVAPQASPQDAAEDPVGRGLGPWRLIHRLASGTVSLIALAHCAVTPLVYSRLSPNAVWFLGAGLGLLLLGVLNWAHIGVEPCRMNTAPVIRWANVVFLAFSLVVLGAVREPQAWAVFVGVLGQAVAGWFTLPGPGAQIRN